MQPTRVTSETATLIDNIFVNDIQTRSSGGNITTSISDHSPEFSFIDIFDKPKQKKAPRYGRTYKNFNEDEFNNELKKINWDELFKHQSSEHCTSLFFNTIDRLLDEMAPVKRLTKKETNLLKRSWIVDVTRFISIFYNRKIKIEKNNFLKFTRKKEI